MYHTDSLETFWTLVRTATATHTCAQQCTLQILTAMKGKCNPSSPPNGCRRLENADAELPAQKSLRDQLVSMISSLL